MKKLSVFVVLATLILEGEAFSLDCPDISEEEFVMGITMGHYLRDRTLWTRVGRLPRQGNPDLEHNTRIDLNNHERRRGTLRCTYGVRDRAGQDFIVVMRAP